MTELFYLFASTFQTNPKNGIGPQLLCLVAIGAESEFRGRPKPWDLAEHKRGAMSGSSLVVETCAVIGTIKQFSYSLSWMLAVRNFLVEYMLNSEMWAMTLMPSVREALGCSGVTSSRVWLYLHLFTQVQSCKITWGDQKSSNSQEGP